MKIDLEVVVPPGDGDTVELIHALTWAKFRHSVGLKTALERTRPELEVSEKQLRTMLQSSWRKIAGLARQGKLEVWGKPVRDRHHDGAAGWRGESQRQLNRVELHNCKFLSWPFEANAERPMPRVERYPDTFSGAIARYSVQGIEEFDFIKVTVDRVGLINEFNIPAAREILRRSSAVKVRRSVTEAVASLSALSLKARNSLTYEDIMTGVTYNHKLSIRYGGEAYRVWKQITAQFPDLSRPGPRQKPPTQ